MRNLGFGGDQEATRGTAECSRTTFSIDGLTNLPDNKLYELRSISLIAAAV